MTLKIGLLGLGTVGSGIPRILEEHKQKITQITGTEIVIAKALVKDEFEKQHLAVQYDIPLTTNIDEIIQDKEIQIVVELMGKIEPARSFILKALSNGKNVVTANKDLLAQHGRELIDCASENDCDLYYEASVAGGIPILRTITNSLAGDEVQRVLGIVNGTTNYMLTKMVSEKMTYDRALKQAQELGFAESNPTNDVDGIDAAYKMVILTQFCFGMDIELSDIEINGIRGLALEDIDMADRLGYVIKLIGSSEINDGHVSASVGPVLVPKQHPLASVLNEYNAVFINSTGVGQSMYYGPGAGSLPTATSVVGDIIEIGKNIKLKMTGRPFNVYHETKNLASDEEIISKYYFSLEVPDKVGQVLKFTEIFTRISISYDQIVQQQADGQRARIVIITHSMTKAQVRKVTAALKEVADFKLLATYKVLKD